jgi:hypothetical protein
MSACACAKVTLWGHEIRVHMLAIHAFGHGRHWLRVRTVITSLCMTPLTTLYG